MPPGGGPLGWRSERRARPRGAGLGQDLRLRGREGQRSPHRNELDHVRETGERCFLAQLTPAPRPLTRSACCSWSLVAAVTGVLLAAPGGSPVLVLFDVDPAAGLSRPPLPLPLPPPCWPPAPAGCRWECARPASGAPLPIPCISCSSTQRRVGEGRGLPLKKGPSAELRTFPHGSSSQHFRAYLTALPWPAASLTPLRCPPTSDGGLSTPFHRSPAGAVSVSC